MKCHDWILSKSDRLLAVFLWPRRVVHLPIYQLLGLDSWSGCPTSKGIDERILAEDEEDPMMPYSSFSGVRRVFRIFHG